MNKLSVAVLLSGREQFSVFYGGALARWTYEVYSRLQESVDACVFGFPTDPATAYPLQYETSAWWRASDLVSRIPGLRRYEDRLWLQALMPRLRHFAVIHIHNRPQWARLLREMGYRGLLIVHLQNDHLGHWTEPMLNDLAPEIDGLIVCSRYLEAQSAAKSAKLAQKTRVIFNGVNTRLFFPSEKLRQPKAIFFVGSFIPEKGALQLIQAFERVLQRHPDASLVIGGSTSFGRHEETEYVRSVRHLAKRLQDEKNAAISFPGYIHHDDDLPAFFQRAALFTSPSLFQEPFGLVNAEAMACATPVVGSRRGGIPEVVGDTGRLIDPEDIAQYADALTELLSDSEGRWRMGRAAMERARTLFDWNVIARTWKAYLEEVTSGKPETSTAAG